MLILLFFILISFIISFIDIKRGIIVDKIILPAILILIILKYFDNSLSLYTLVAVVIVLCIFLVPIVLNMAFGGGDLRFGVFCALFLGLELIGPFIMMAGVVHLVILGVVRKKSFAFAPAMSIAALASYMIGKI